MRALFNCSCIKNVYLRTEGDFVELEIYNDDNSKSFVSRKKIRGLANPEYFIEKYENVKFFRQISEKFVRLRIWPPCGSYRIEKHRIG